MGVATLENPLDNSLRLQATLTGGHIHRILGLPVVEFKNHSFKQSYVGITF